jgi:hypothetical protein
MLLVHRGAIASSAGVGLAHVSALFGVPVVARAGEVIDARSRVDPNDGIGGTSRPRLLVGGILAYRSCRWSRVVCGRAAKGIASLFSALRRPVRQPCRCGSEATGGGSYFANRRTVFTIQSAAPLISRAGSEAECKSSCVSGPLNSVEVSREWQ